MEVAEYCLSRKMSSGCICKVAHQNIKMLIFSRRETTVMRIILNTMCEFHSKSLKALCDLEDEYIRPSNLFILCLFKNLIFLLPTHIEKSISK